MDETKTADLEIAARIVERFQDHVKAAGVSESDIIHETANHWVTKEKFKGRDVYRVWRHSASGTHGTLVATVDLGDRGAQRAIDECDRRERELEKRKK